MTVTRWTETKMVYGPMMPQGWAMATMMGRLPRWRLQRWTMATKMDSHKDEQLEEDELTQR